jgi:hypothetical protein
MRRNLLVAAVSLPLLCVSLCADPFPFKAVLNGPSEEPPNASPGTGFALIVIDPTAHTLSIDVDFADLVGTTTASHIHVINGPGDGNLLDTNGPVATTVPTFPGFPLGVTAGSYTQTFDTTLAASFNPSFVTNSGGLAAAENELFDAIFEGRAYLNIHSTFRPGGEIRGFLQPVPEPSTWALLGAVGVLLFRRFKT